MSISHVCLSCGFDLARVRIAREPHYGFPLVRCPLCSVCSVRRRHPLHRAWRNFLRMDWALSMLLIQVVLLLGMLVLTWGCAALLYASLVVHVLDHEVIGLPSVFVIVLGVAPLVIGAWIRAAYSHWSWPRAWLTWGFIVLVPLNVLALGAIFGLRPPAQLRTAVESISGNIAVNWLVMCLPLSIIAGVMLLLAPAGVPLGRLWLWGHSHARAARNRLRRKRLRAVRRG